jgi:ribosomal protein S18 acetylase RimI-like enzyme
VVNKYDIPMFVRFGYVFVAKCENNIVGAIVSYKTSKDEIYICDLVVDPKYRNLKIGEKLRIRLFKEVKGMNVVSFLDPKNTPIINLNKKMGAKIVARVKDAYGLDSESILESGIRLFVRTKNK